MVGRVPTSPVGFVNSIPPDSLESVILGIANSFMSFLYSKASIITLFSTNIKESFNNNESVNKIFTLA